MNPAQRRLVVKCAAIGGLIAAVVVFERWILENWSWLKWVSLPVIAIGAAVEGRPGRPPDIERWAESSPFIKPWLAVCALIISVVAVATTHTSFRIPDDWMFRGLVLTFVVLLGPFAIIGVRERYRELGDKHDAT
jgi:hypothetical protein